MPLHLDESSPLDGYLNRYNAQLRHHLLQYHPELLLLQLACGKLVFGQIRHRNVDNYFPLINLNIELVQGHLQKNLLHLAQTSKENLHLYPLK